jgi:FixJ family two-component response regulator
VHALVTDVVMPGTWNGLELARRVRAVAPTMPIVLMTGYDLGPEVVSLRCVPLRKPFDAEALHSALRRARDLVASG